MISGTTGNTLTSDCVSVACVVANSTHLNRRERIMDRSTVLKLYNFSFYIVASLNLRSVCYSRNWNLCPRTSVCRPQCYSFEMMEAVWIQFVRIRCLVPHPRTQTPFDEHSCNQRLRCHNQWQLIGTTVHRIQFHF